MLQRILGGILMQSTFDLTFSSLGGMGRQTWARVLSPPASPNAELPPQAPRVPQTEQGLANPPLKNDSRIKSLRADNEVRDRDSTVVRLLTPLLFLPPQGLAGI
jgi:hypothetical protein